MDSSRILAAGLGFATVLVSYPVAAAELPIVCSGGSCNGLGWVTKGSATAVVTSDTFRIVQGTDKAILNWQSFNVGADGKVTFEQPNASSIALNRIFQNDPSRIFGAVEANGQIFLVNQNGFLFGAGSRVKVGGLLVSTLDMTDSVFDEGLAASRGSTPALASTRTGENRNYVLDAAGKPKLDSNGDPIPVSLVVAEGASIATTSSSGRALLAGQIVDNSGTIDTPGGQLILAAGEKVYLQASEDPDLRGLLVEVDGEGEAWNRLTGELSASRGNITVVGLAINQRGRISANSTVSANGSVKLVARSNIDQDQASGSGALVATQGGKLDIGSSSVIEVLPDSKDTATAVDDQAQAPSLIELGGQSVFMRGGARFTAPGGTMTVDAGSDPRIWGVLNNPQPDPGAKIRVESGVDIDLSGSDVELPVSRAIVAVELRANELKDSPNQREGVLRGQTVYVDARVGTPLADVSSAIAAIPKGVAERTSNGGTVKFSSAGDTVFGEGAHIDVSGGTISYQGGTVQTTQLIGSDGKTYDISEADASRTYVGLINPTYKRTYDRWGVTETLPGLNIGRSEPGYREGRSAGTVQFTAPNLVVDGSLLGTTTVGALQREQDDQPSGGKLIIGSALTDSAFLDYGAPSVTLVNERNDFAIGDDASLTGQRTLELPVDLLTDSGFTRTEIYSNGNVSLPTETPLDLGAGYSLSVVANRVDILSDITTAGGTIKAYTDKTAGIPGLTLSDPGVHVGNGVTLDVRGQWTNDEAAVASGNSAVSSVFLDGGTIDLGVSPIRDFGKLTDQRFDADISIGSDASLRASGGAWRDADGGVTGGRGGSIKIRAGNSDQNGQETGLQVGSNISMDAFGVQGAAGGSFLLSAPRIDVTSAGEWTQAQRVDDDDEDGSAFFHVGSSLFSNYGFSSVSLVATGSAVDEVGPEVMAVRSGTTVDARTRSIQLGDNAAFQASAETIDGFSSVVMPLDLARQAMTVSLSAEPEGGARAGVLAIEAGSTMFADPGATFAFSSVGSIAIAGDITAHAGTIGVSLETPPPSVEAGYDPDLKIDIASTALLDVSGVSQVVAADGGLRTGEVLDGGRISFIADRGSLMVNDGAKIDISGTADTIDFTDTSGAKPTLTRRTVASAGGSLELRAPESLIFLGDLDAAAGVGGTGTAAGGSLSVQLTRARGFSEGNGTGPAFPNTDRVLRISSEPIAVSDVASGLGILSTATINESGIDSLNIESGDRIEFDGGVDIHMARELKVDAPVISTPTGGEVNLSAAYVGFGNSVVTSQRAASQTAGGGMLTVHGDLIDLVGNTSLDSIGTAIFDSSGDLRMTGVADSGANAGSMNIAGDLTLRAERIFPNTATQFSLVASGGTNDTVRLEQAATTNDSIPLAVGGVVKIEGRHIVQDGTLLAPFGSIDLSATDSLRLTARSRTSVAGGGKLFPFGQTQLGEWVYSQNGVLTTQEGVPVRNISLTGDSVDLDSGATVDLSGGGDLYSYEWVPGTGGSKDALAGGVTKGLYAIVPSLGSDYAPYDPAEYDASGLSVGQSVYLSGGGGIPAGTYALLPASYALLPGAYLVEAVGGSVDFSAGQTATYLDGSTIVSGHYTFGNTGIGDTRARGFIVRPGSYSQDLATYQLSYASGFFKDRAATRDLPVPALPADAGSLAVSAGRSLIAAANVLTRGAEGGEGATIDLAASNLEIVNEIDPGTVDAVQVTAAVLEKWNPAHLLLGGTREAGETVDVVANSVVFKEGVNLSLGEIVATALDEVTVESGAQVQSTAAAAGSNVEVADLDHKTIKLNGSSAQAAMLAVSDLAVFDVERAADSTGPAGRVTVRDGSVVGARGSLTVLAPGGGSLAANALEGEGAAWQIGARNIAFGADEIADGLAIDSQILARLQRGYSASFESAGRIDFLDSLHLGGSGSSLEQISLTAGTLHGDNGSDVTLEAGTVSLNGAAADAAAPVSGSSTMHIVANNVELGEGSLALSGFDTTTIDAATRVRGEGESRLRFAGDLAMNTGLLTTASAADVKIEGADDSVVRIDSAGSAADTSELGGALSISGHDVFQAGNIVMPSGLVTLTASGQLSVLDGALVDVAGREVTAGGRTSSSSGGTITLVSAGALNVAGGSTLDVGGAGRSDAGDIHARAGGAATFAGAIDGHAGTGARGGSFDLSAGSLTNFSALNSALETGGLDALRNIKTASGNLVLRAGEAINASSVLLEADGGNVSVAGTINARSRDERSDIGLFGRNVTLESTGVLRADGVGDDGRGGDVILGSSVGRVSLKTGSLISTRGETEAGAVRLRAALVGNDVNIDPLLGRVEGPASVTIEPVTVFNVGSSVTSEQMTTIRDQVTSRMSGSSSAIRDRLEVDGGPQVSLEAGVELRRAGDLQLGAAGGTIDLASWRFTDDEGSTGAAALTVKATGNIAVSGTLTDGLEGTTLSTLMPGSSSTLRFVAGASLDSANPLGLNASAPADFTLDSNSIIRTGTGDIDIAAGQDIVFGATNASIYTMGSPGAATLYPNLASSVYFPVHGGQVSLAAGEDITRLAQIGSTPSAASNITTWQSRSLRTQDVAWGSDVRRFNWNVGSLGGGDVSIRAGNDVADISVNAGDSARVVNDEVVHFDGGHLTMESGGDINSVAISVTNGYNRIEADGELGYTRSISSANGDIPVGSLLFMQNDADVQIDARTGVILENVVNPTLLVSSVVNRLNYNTYDEGAALHVASTAGNVTLNYRKESLESLVSGLRDNNGSASNLPPTLTMAAVSGDIVVSGPSTLYQSDAGQLDLFAARDIDMSDGGGSFTMSAIPESSTKTPLNPNARTSAREDISPHSASARHQNDAVAAVVTAGRDIRGGQLNLAKSVTLVAGRDIINTNLSTNNLNASDRTLVMAGRDLRYTSDRTDGEIEVGGPGRLDVITNRNIDLGFSRGITTDGNIRNADLDTSEGADLTVVAGTSGALDPDAFLTEIVSESKDYRDLLVDYVQRETGESGLDYETALAKFNALDSNEQQPLLLSIFFRELVAAGREANLDPSTEFERGYAAIDTLFSGSRQEEGSTTPNPYAGNIGLTFSRIYTLSGGNVSLVAPGGFVNVGLANPPKTIAPKQPSELGIVAQGAGDVRIFASDDVLVNASRIFTLGGGDIAVWSTTGDIDAGRGSKSAVSAPAPVVLIDATGNVTINFAGAVQGSGIRTISAGDNVEPGDVDLIAPAGIVNAGDAGIGAAGNLNVAAAQVVGLDNIQVGGTSTGVPSEVSSLGASLTSVSAVSTASSSGAGESLGESNAQQAAPLAESALGWLDVFVEGFGEEVCKPNDTECLERNRAKQKP